jgi:hypothetical protein
LVWPTCVRHTLRLTVSVVKSAFRSVQRRPRISDSRRPVSAATRTAVRAGSGSTLIATRDGREKFRAAARVSLGLGDWLASNYPFGGFIANYATFAKKIDLDAAKKKVTEEDLKRTYEIAKAAHAKQWAWTSRRIQIQDQGPKDLFRPKSN